MPVVTETGTAQSEKMRIVERYIGQHLDGCLKREILAAMTGYSVPHLHRVFRASTGESVARYIRRLRLKRAGQKLRMGAVDIGMVAQAAGYASHAAFGKAFRQQFGLSPGEFRRLDFLRANELLRRV